MPFAFPLNLTRGALDLHWSFLTDSGVYDHVFAPYRKKPLPLAVLCTEKYRETTRVRNNTENE